MWRRGMCTTTGRWGCPVDSDTRTQGDRDLARLKLGLLTSRGPVAGAPTEPCDVCGASHSPPLSPSVTADARRGP